jgi:putative Mg2+ transporter-C (MgtC) family protein
LEALNDPIDVRMLLLRIAIGAALGGVIGYERDLHGRPVGLRTHVIVALAAATFMVISAHFVFYQHYVDNGVVDVDASRIAASVVSAIGFLAGGAILRTGVTIQGLTTAAGLWLVTAIGMSAGAGMFTVAVAVTIMGTLALTVLRRFEDKNDALQKHHIQLEAPVLDVAATVKELEALGAVVSQLAVERLRGEKARTTLRLTAVLPRDVPRDKLLATLEAVPDVRRVQIGDPE